MLTAVHGLYELVILGRKSKPHDLPVPPGESGELVHLK